MFLPDGPGIESCVHRGTIFNCVEASNPSEARWILALEEGTFCDCSYLLNNFGKKAFKKLREMFALSLFDNVAAEFNGLKVAQMSRGFRRCLRRGLSRLGNGFGRRQIANCNNS